MREYREEISESISIKMSRISRHVILAVMSIILCALVLILANSVILQNTIFRSGFLYKYMDSSDYFEKTEMEVSLNLKKVLESTELPEDFFNNFLFNTNIRTDTLNNIESLYSGNTQFLEKTKFEETLGRKLEKLKLSNEIKDESDIVDRSVSVYLESVELHQFEKLAVEISQLKGLTEKAIYISAACSVVLILLIFFLSKWRHRAYKVFFFVSIGSAALQILLCATAFFSFKTIYPESNDKINLFVYQTFNDVMLIFAVFVVVFFIVGMAMLLVHRLSRDKVIRQSKLSRY